MSSRHPDLLANLLARSVERATLSQLLGVGESVTVQPGTGMITTGPAPTTGSLDVYMEAETVGAWLAPVTLPVMVPVFFAGRFTSWQLIADDAYAELVVEIWRDTLANLPPTSADLISGTAPPTLAGARSASSAALTGWATAFSAGDVFNFNLRPSPWRVNRATLSLKWARS